MGRPRPKVPADPMTATQAVDAVVIYMRQYADQIANASDLHEAAKIINAFLSDTAPIAYGRDVVIRDMLRKGYPYERIAFKLEMSKGTINSAIA